MNHFRPQSFIPTNTTTSSSFFSFIPRPQFEGYYSKFDLPSSAQLIVIICSVPNVPKQQRPHMVSFTYIPPQFPDVSPFQRELFPNDIQMNDHYSNRSPPFSPTSSPASQPRLAFDLNIPGVGFMAVYDENSTIYDLKDPEGSFSFSASVPGVTLDSSNRIPWSGTEQPFSSSTPEGLFVHLPLPLHWHVHTLSSRCSFNLTIEPSIYAHVHPLDSSLPSPTTTKLPTTPLLPLSPPTLPPTRQTATVHQEKNWANSFPTSHIWIQAHNVRTRTSLSLAGGHILNTTSFLISYRASNPTHSITFRPPFALRPNFSPHLPLSSILTQLSPLTTDISWATRTVLIAVSSFTRRIEIEATAPKGSFVGMSAPFEDGHRSNFLGQSFRARVKVTVYEASCWGLGHWRVVCEEVFEGAGLEFGGDCYGDEDRGVEKDEGKGEGGWAWVS